MARRARLRRRSATPLVIRPDADATRPVTTPVGNQALGRLVAAGTGRGGAAAAEPDVAQPAAPVGSVSTGRLLGADQGPDGFSFRLEEELAGHGNGPAAKGTSVPAATATATTGAVDVDIDLTVNEPTETTRPAEEIASAHDQEGAVGWTTPRFSLQTSASSPTSGSVDVTIDFTIELAEEFTGRTLDVLRDHEMGHVHIGRSAAEVVLVDMLERNLEALPALTRAAAEPVIDSAGEWFTFWEGTLSWLYDRVDYPRMREAYLGARMSLDELVALTPEVGTMADALRSFAAVGDEPADVLAAARSLHDARGALDDLAVTRVQYNDEFEELVFGVDEAIARLLTSLEDGSETEAELRRVMAMLGDFAWKAPGSE